MSFYKLFKYHILNSGRRVGCFFIIGTPDGAIVTPVTTCQGRDHIVTIRSGERVLVVVNVHFEPDVVLRDLRESTTHVFLPELATAYIHVLMPLARDCWRAILIFAEHLGGREIHTSVIMMTVHGIVVTRRTNDSFLFLFFKHVPSWKSQTSRFLQDFTRKASAEGHVIFIDYSHVC